MPMLMGHSKKQLQLINEMGATFRSVMKKYSLAPGDFPEIESFKSIAREQDFTKFPSLKQKLIDDVEHVLGKDIPRLMDALPRSWEGDGFYIEGDVVVTGDGSGDGNGDFGNPFGDDSRPPAPPDTFVADDYKEQFRTAANDGKVDGKTAKTILLSFGLEKAVLRRLWDLADIDQDGALDEGEFLLAMRLCEMARSGKELPKVLDPSMIPSGK